MFGVMSGMLHPKAPTELNARSSALTIRILGGAVSFPSAFDFLLMHPERIRIKVDKIRYLTIFKTLFGYHLG
jgi:hypothetical protein